MVRGAVGGVYRYHSGPKRRYHWGKGGVTQTDKRTEDGKYQA